MNFTSYWRILPLTEKYIEFVPQNLISSKKIEFEKKTDKNLTRAVGAEEGGLVSTRSAHVERLE